MLIQRHAPFLPSSPSALRPVTVITTTIVLLTKSIVLGSQDQISTEILMKKKTNAKKYFIYYIENFCRKTFCEMLIIICCP